MIHKYKQNGFFIVIDVNSGGVHLVDELTYNLLDIVDENTVSTITVEALAEQLSAFSQEDIASALKELRSLYKNGVLFTSDDEYRQFEDLMVDAPIKAMCLHVAHDCNLRCKYCFAATGDFGTGRKLMTPETGRQAIDFLIENSGTRRNLEVDFFGGEPLMNFDMVKQTVDYAHSIEKEKGKNFRFTITTNGLLLTDDKIEYINHEMSNVVLSIDGRREINDSLRVRVDGSGSYDSIVPKYRKLVERRSKDKDYYVRGTFTSKNIDFDEDVFHLYREGFDQISVEPVVSEEEAEYAITSKQLPQVFESYERLTRKLTEAHSKNDAPNFFHFMIDLEQGPCAIKRLRGCGCGNEYVAITPDGDIYPCHQFVGMDDWKMGTVEDGSINKTLKDHFAATTIYQKEGCRDCWARFYCSGGCNANNQQYAGNILKPHELSCELEKKRVECAIALQAALATAE